LPGSHTIQIEKKPDVFLEEGAKHPTQEEDGALGATERDQKEDTFGYVSLLGGLRDDTKAP
jgi:hypothetical protein